MSAVKPAIRFDWIAPKSQFALSGVRLSEMNVGRFLFVEIILYSFTNPATKQVAMAGNASTKGSP